METITKIEVVTKPLKKFIYLFSEMTESTIEDRHGSQLLVSAYMEMEEEERAHAQTLDEGDAPAPRIRTLTKPKFTIFDYSEIEHDQLEENVAALINKDGYYDEMVPLDEEEEEKKKVENLGKKIALISLSVIVTAAILFFIMRL